MGSSPTPGSLRNRGAGVQRLLSRAGGAAEAVRPPDAEMSTSDSSSASPRHLLRRARIRLIAARLCADGRSRRRLVELLELGRFEPHGEPEPIALRALGGDSVHVRAGSADPDVLVGAFHGLYHLPSAELPSPRLIWDLGANIGLTMRQMATAFPNARIVGVELDPTNIELARRNLAPVAERTEIVEGAVWPEHGTLSYGLPDGEAEDSFRVGEPGAGTAAAVTLDELRDRFGAPDYVKMDIEGAERDVLERNTAWADAITRIGVEYHDPYSLGDCRRDLTALGFTGFEVHRRGLMRRGSDSLYAFRASSESAR